MRRTAAALVLALAACSKQPAASAPAAPAGAAPAAAGADGSAASTGAFVTAASALRREPTDAARVPGPSRKDVPNTLTVLQRGERVTVLEAREEWSKVRSSDDTDGWLRGGSLLEGEITAATVLVPTDVFDRPDLLAANAKRRIEPGTLLLVVRAKAPFSEVNVSSGPNAWVLSERLATAEREVSVAKLTEKARWLVRGGKAAEAKQLLSLAREHFAGSPLVDALAVELGEQPPPPAPGAAPSVLPASVPAAPAPAAAAPPAAPAPAPGAGSTGG